MTSYQHIVVPVAGQKSAVNADNSLNVPDQPVIAKAYGGSKNLLNGSVRRRKGDAGLRLSVWLAYETLHAVRDCVVSIKGPLTTPVGGGIRSLNVELRQELDLYRAPAMG
jgi:isocitrate dehydrogenase